MNPGVWGLCTPRVRGHAHGCTPCCSPQCPARLCSLSFGGRVAGGLQPSLGRSSPPCLPRALSLICFPSRGSAGFPWKPLHPQGATPAQGLGTRRGAPSQPPEPPPVAGTGLHVPGRARDPRGRARCHHPWVLLLAGGEQHLEAGGWDWGLRAAAGSGGAGRGAGGGTEPPRCQSQHRGLPGTSPWQELSGSAGVRAH